MIPAPPAVNYRRPDLVVEERRLLADAALHRAAIIAITLRHHGRLLITREALALWPDLERLDLLVLGRHVDGQVWKSDYRSDGIMLVVESSFASGESR